MRPISVYVHIPFCTYKCGYCDFNAYAWLDALMPAYARALVAEIAGYADVLAWRTIDTPTALDLVSRWPVVAEAGSDAQDR